MIENAQLITQGEMVVSDNPRMVISTLLGSCVAVCLFDPLAKVGGMNHMLLASGKKTSTLQNSQGVYSMELLINDVLKIGGARNRLEAKVFGGASMLNGATEIGAANARFALDFLFHESIAVTGQSLGGTNARQLVFNPTTGVVRQKVLRMTKDDVAPAKLAQPDAGNDLELL